MGFMKFSEQEKPVVGFIFFCLSTQSDRSPGARKLGKNLKEFLSDQKNLVLKGWHTLPVFPLSLPSYSVALDADADVVTGNGWHNVKPSP